MADITLFYSYSHKDEELQKQLTNHLSSLKRRGIISEWHDRKISPGKEWEGQIDKHLSQANIILLLISSDFLASDYCYGIEMKKALERHEAKEARVIPVILRPVAWKGLPFEKLQALPKDAKPVTKWQNIDEAFCDIAEGISRSCTELKKKSIQPTHPIKRDASYPAEDKRTSDKRQNSNHSDIPEKTIRDKELKKTTTANEVQVYCNRCGANPGGNKVTCLGGYSSHDFVQTDKPVYCSRCGHKPGEPRTTCLGGYSSHNFVKYSGPVYCSRCGTTLDDPKTTCSGGYSSHNYVELP
jgi:hypothetical protein